MLVSPHLTGRSAAGLNLVEQEDGAVVFANLLQSLKFEKFILLLRLFNTKDYTMNLNKTLVNCKIGILHRNLHFLHNLHLSAKATSVIANQKLTKISYKNNYQTANTS